MIKALIFDLSEVLIRGIVGVEKILAKQLHIPEGKILKAFNGNNLVNLCCGKISEDEYLRNIIDKQNWSISSQELKTHLRQNFLIPVNGMPELINDLSEKYKLILLSDHGREWIEYIEVRHEFLNCFDKRHYSFNSNKLKSDPSIFITILKENGLSREEVIFIDDNKDNIAAAASVGIRGIIFKNRAQFTKIFNT